MRVDGDLDIVWKAYVRYVNLKRDRLEPPADATADVGWYWAAYPSLSPLYPIPTANPEWMDAWSMQDFHGYWW